MNLCPLSQCIWTLKMPNIQRENILKRPIPTANAWRVERWDVVNGNVLRARLPLCSTEHYLQGKVCSNDWTIYWLIALLHDQLTRHMTWPITICVRMTEVPFLPALFGQCYSIRPANKEIYFWFMYNLGQKFYPPQIRADWALNSWPPDHDSTFHVTEMPALTTWPSVTFSKEMYFHIILGVWGDFKCMGSQIDWWTGNWHFWLKYNLEQKYYTPQVRSSQGSDSWPSHHDSTFHVTESLVKLQAHSWSSASWILTWYHYPCSPWYGGSKLLCSNGHLDRSRWVIWKRTYCSISFFFFLSFFKGDRSNCYGKFI